jgi:CMP-N-acetylneuraminic acid synthetase
MKAHSERVPGKNFRALAGKPLVRWILDTLLSLDEVTRVVINTDARGQLAELGIVDGPRTLIRDRAPPLCGDLVSMNRILENDLAAVPSDLYLMTHTTNPLLSAATVRAALAALAQAPAADSLFTVNRLQTRFYRADGSPVNHDPAQLIRTQDLEPWFEENSCLYLFTRESFAATGARIGRRPLMFPTPPLESVDIDEPHQWFMAEALLEKRQREGAGR